MVPRAGFEPATIGLEVHCSIQLSYRGVYALYKKRPRWVEVLWSGCGESNPDSLLGRQVH